MGSKNKEQVLLWFISAQHERHGSHSGRPRKIWPHPNRIISGVIDSTAVPLDLKILKQEPWLPSRPQKYAQLFIATGSWYLAYSLDTHY